MHNYLKLYFKNYFVTSNVIFYFAISYSSISLGLNWNPFNVITVNVIRFLHVEVTFQTPQLFKIAELKHSIVWSQIVPIVILSGYNSIPVKHDVIIITKVKKGV